MKCCSRSTFGVSIGFVNIVIYLGVCIGMIHLYRDAPNTNGKFRLIAGLVVVVALAMAAVSGLLIFGIIKRLHSFIFPWLVISGVVFICNCVQAFVSLILAIKESTPSQTWHVTLLIDLLALVVHGLILWPIYTLNRDISKNDNQHMEPLNIVVYSVPASL